MRQHQPWTTAPPGLRPARCTSDPNQFPSFLRFDREASNAETFREDFICNAYLSAGGCDLTQPLESAYRALVIHDAREREGNAGLNAGFVRDNAFLGIVVVTDEEDGSVRDCRYAESGVACDDATSVFDAASTRWASPDLARRFYDYVPGSAQDPTWPIDRYIDPTNPRRGFTSLKPGRPDLIIFAAIAGVPIHPPTRVNGSTTEIDWNALLGANPDGSDGYVGTSAEGPISMRQRNMAPACSTRVVPACRREGSTLATTCDPAAQYFAWPSRRIAQVVRRFDERYHNGVLGSVCRSDYAETLTRVAERIQSRLRSPCLLQPLETAPAPCEPGDPRRGCARLTRCRVREFLPPGVTAEVCPDARGRTPGDHEAQGTPASCLVRELALPAGEAPPARHEGFYYDTRVDPRRPDCRHHLYFTPGGALYPGATWALECVRSSRYGSW